MADLPGHGNKLCKMEQNRHLTMKGVLERMAPANIQYLQTAVPFVCASASINLNHQKALWAQGCGYFNHHANMTTSPPTVIQPVNLPKCLNRKLLKDFILLLTVLSSSDDRLFKNDQKGKNRSLGNTDLIHLQTWFCGSDLKTILTTFKDVNTFTLILYRVFSKLQTLIC